ncbi:MAG TPA: sugar ABC transporter ATP-binding protein [Clostridiales bacterium]|nr:sugar ABC transporter ATP-binding protein [Clostridiales bacterium]
MQDYILQIKNVSKSFSGVYVLKKVNMNVKRGEVHVVVGENGAGKSTLMKIISGVYQKDEGEIIFEGKPVSFRGAGDALDKGISIIHQEFNLLPHRTIGQNIFLGREPIKGRFFKTIDQDIVNRRSKELLDFLGVDIDPRTKVYRLGIAQQQMVEVAKALSFKSKVLIMDEPTATLTQKEIVKLFNMIERLKNEGVSIIYISHRLEELKHIADTITVLRDGEMVGTLDGKDASIDEIIRLMVGREIKNQYKREYCVPGEEVLRTENLCSLRFKDVNISVRRGEIVGLSGLVGAGRTEVAKSIFGYDIIEKGCVYFYGKKYNKVNTKLTTRLKIGFLSEDRKEEGTIIEMPMKYNITHASLKRLFKNNIISNKVETQVATKYKDDLNIRTTSVNKLVKLLSGGNQQKVVVAKWLCAACDIFIFDEPTRGIDVGAKAEIYEIMNALVKEGKAILMISSDLPELIGLCDRIYTMKDGRITGEFTKDEATQEKILSYCV